MLKIKRLVYQGEDETVEFKRKIVHPEKVIKEVVAFANSKGGYLLVGVDDNQTIPGLKYPEEEDFIMQKAFRDLIRPKVDFDTHLIRLNEKRAVICYYIHPGQNKPYYAFEKKSHRYGKAFVRVKDRSIQASPEIRKILKFNNAPKDVQFSYGENESRLFRFLHDNGHITLPQFQEMTGLDYKPSSQILIQMVLANALKILPRESEDWYMAAE
ncbi:helix-turn-helix domain-containing protein [Marinoscillum sp. MHG1-6]|uniref:AlbA family DNA-binding domain-containing protein n=1 Tax=Marinoscillum sp. MHG1-6 TaxID=2959627 RepID=UPI002158911A|nr:ATP-binding protein [Marinoscillum sp. MHG1-6]